MFGFVLLTIGNAMRVVFCAGWTLLRHRSAEGAAALVGMPEGSTGWERRKEPGSGVAFYFNRETGVSAWERPAGWDTTRKGRNVLFTPEEVDPPDWRRLEDGAEVLRQHAGWQELRQPGNVRKRYPGHRRCMTGLH